MKKNRSLFSLVIFSAVISLLFVSSVAASSDFVLTPTRDPRTPPATPTPGGGFEIGSGNSGDVFECPVGGVQGYGTVTPDAMWMSVCGQCIPTGTPVATFDFNNFPTRTPVTWVSGTPNTPDPYIELTYTPITTYTPYPTGTVTSTPTGGTITCDAARTIGGTCQQLSPYLVKAQITLSTDTVRPFNEDGNYGRLGIVAPQLNQVLYVTYENPSWIVNSFYGVDRSATLYTAVGSSILQQWTGINLPANGQITFGQSWLYYTMTATQTVVGSRPQLFYIGGNNTGSLGDYSMSGSTTIYVSSQGYYYSVTATPTVTPGVGYCAAINNGMDGLTDQDMDFWSPAGPASCLIIPSLNTNDLFNFEEMPGWIGLLLGGAVQVDRIQETLEGFLGGYQIYTTAMTLCLQPYEFAPVYLFGNIMLIQTIADIGLILYAVSILRSR